MPGLLDPITVRGLTIRNRIVMPPMATNMATVDGGVIDQHIEHYAARARAGVGLIIIEHCYILADGRVRDSQIGIHDDSLIPGLRRLAQAVQAEGASIGVQINHNATDEFVASLSVEEIGAITEAFGQAARRAAEAGFDVVEVHGAHGYLLSRFLSPLSNKRQDQYGGDPARRLRFPLEAIGRVRSVLGPEFPLSYRFGASDLLPGGLTADDAATIAPELVAAGIDILDISGGVGGSGRDQFDEQGFLVGLANQVKQACGAIVIGVGNVQDPHYADRVVREGLVDMVAVGRAQLSDPDWARRAAQTLGWG